MIIFESFGIMVKSTIQGSRVCDFTCSGCIIAAGLVSLTFLPFLKAGVNGEEYRLQADI